jgi:hypothetical protein
MWTTCKSKHITCAYDVLCRLPVTERCNIYKQNHVQWLSHSVAKLCARSTMSSHTVSKRENFSWAKTLAGADNVDCGHLCCDVVWSLRCLPTFRRNVLPHNVGDYAFHRYIQDYDVRTQNTNVRFQVLTAASMKFRVFWDVLLCSLTDVDRRFRGACCLHHYRPDDGGDTYLSNIDLLLLHYKTLYRRRLSSSYSPPWEPEISRDLYLSPHTTRCKEPHPPPWNITVSAGLFCACRSV